MRGLGVGPKRRSARGLGHSVAGDDPPRGTEPAGGGPPEWREWMQQLGQRLRRLRELVDLSQEQLAKLAGVSQGAVSRLETARGLATPLLVVLKINLALGEVLRRVDPAMLDADLRHALDLQAAIGPALRANHPEAGPVTSDPRIEDLLRLYRKTPERHRERLLAIISAAVRGLKEIDGSEE